MVVIQVLLVRGGRCREDGRSEAVVVGDTMSVVERDGGDISLSSSLLKAQRGRNLLVKLVS